MKKSQYPMVEGVCSPSSQAQNFFSVGNEKFTLNLSNCPDCKLAEYACIGEHAH